MMKCDPRAFARCPYSAQCGDSPNNTEFYEGSECDYFNQKVLDTLSTNADRIRAMSDIELAEFIPNWSYTKACKCDEELFVDCDNECEKCVAEWLQQPAEEDVSSWKI